MAVRSCTGVSLRDGARDSAAEGAVLELGAAQTLRPLSGLTVAHQQVTLRCPHDGSVVAAAATAAVAAAAALYTGSRSLTKDIGYVTRGFLLLLAPRNGKVSNAGVEGGRHSPEAIVASRARD